MFDFSLTELIIILIFLFPLPPLITGLLARKKMRRFWVWFGIGTVICLIANLTTGIILPGFQLYIGAIAGPVAALFIKPV